jgi:hypothetical protein
MNHTIHNFLFRLYEELARELSARLQEEICMCGWGWIETASYTLDTSPFIYDPKVFHSDIRKLANGIMHHTSGS